MHLGMPTKQRLVIIKFCPVSNFSKKIRRISNCAGFERSCTPSISVWCCLKTVMIFLAGQLHMVLRIFKAKNGQI